MDFHLDTSLQIDVRNCLFKGGLVNVEDTTTQVDLELFLTLANVHFESVI